MMNTRFSACAVSATNAAATIATAIMERMEPPNRHCTAPHFRVATRQGCDLRVKHSLTSAQKEECRVLRPADSTALRRDARGWNSRQFRVRALWRVKHKA